MPQFNAHKVFHNAPRNNDFRKNITVEDAKIALLRNARNTIREAISDKFTNWESIIPRRELFESQYSLPSPSITPKIMRPKFRGQGSYAYETLNSPAYPSQQIDFDDGIFMPATFVTKVGQTNSATPIIRSNKYFQLIEAIVQPVCDAKGWTLVKEKPSCIRVLIDDECHLDLALYSIPDNEFALLIEKANAVANNNNQSAFDSIEFADSAYTALQSDKVMLAHRTEQWKESDPRKLETWFTESVKDHGEQLRRVCRYLKAWRDYTFEGKCNLSSIALMKCTVDAYDELKGEFDQNRDDAAILMVAEKLPSYFNDPAGIINPVLPEQKLNDQWDANDKLKYTHAANDLIAHLRTALNQSVNTAGTQEKLALILGDRIPEDLSLIVPLSAESVVTGYSRSPVKQPSTPLRTTSG